MAQWGFVVGLNLEIVFIAFRNVKCCTTLKAWMFVSLKKGAHFLSKYGSLAKVNPLGQ